MADVTVRLVRKRHLAVDVVEFLLNKLVLYFMSHCNSTSGIVSSFVGKMFQD